MFTLKEIGNRQLNSLHVCLFLFVLSGYLLIFVLLFVNFLRSVYLEGGAGRCQMVIGKSIH